MASGYVAGLSFGQRQIRMAELLRPGRTLFAMPLLVRIEGRIDPDALRAALAMVARRHDSLRASFPLVNGAPVQAVADEVPLPFAVIATGEAFDSPAFDATLAVQAQAMVDEPFDLSAGPLARFSLVRAADDGGVLVAVLHHIISDGASLTILRRDLLAAYDAALAGRPEAGAPLPLQFPDVADWEQERFGAPGPALDAAMAAWRTRLAGAPARLDLPYDRAPSESGSLRSAQAELHVPGDVAIALAGLARREGASEFSLYLTLLFVVLRRWSGLDDLVVTIPAARRDRPDLADMIGLLVDTLPIRASVADEARFPALLGEVQDSLRAALAQRDLPFERIIEASGVERRGEAAPFLQVLFGAAEPPAPTLTALDGTRFAILPEQLDQEAKAELSVVYAAAPDGLRLWCRYDAMLFDTATIDAVLGWFGRLAQALAAQPDQPVLEVPLLSGAEGAAQLARFNGTALAYERQDSAIALFLRDAARHPDAIAIEEDGLRLSYGALADRVRRLAGVLATQGVAAGEVVLLVLPVSGALIEAQLAVLALGAAYAPIDPTYPAEQRDVRARQVGARHAVALDPSLATEGCATLGWAALREAAEAAAPHPEVASSAHSPAYVMFTSGSTGTPKAVSVPHRAIVRLARAQGLAAPGLRAAVYSNPAFDASTLEIWVPLLNGGTLLPVDRTVVMDPRALRLFLHEGRISLLWITAGLFQQIAALDPAAFAGPRLVITGGDVVNPVAARAVLAAGRAKGLALFNGYGPTENTTFSTLFDIADLRVDELTIPIGRPISNSTAYVLDPAGRPLPPGLVGELWVGGDGVALGYHGDADLTAARFRPDPFATDPAARMYRTGDLARWRTDGSIVFLGRSDRQVKVRGFRIELGEIEAVLALHPGVGGAAVLAPRRASGERDLVAYVAPKAGLVLTAGELRAHLEARLPRQMLPQAYLLLDRLPLNANGKVDTRALPAVEIAETPAEAPVEPRTPEERILARIWADLLNTAGFGVRDNFFHVGGDSILTIRLVARAYEAGLDLELKDVFDQPTIEGLAAIALRRQRAVQARSHGARYGAELIAAACDSRNPCRFVSVSVPATVSTVDLGYAIERLAERHDALRLVRVEDATGRSLAISDFLPAVPVRFVDVPTATLDDLDRWITENSARLARGIDLAAGVTIAATLVTAQAPAAGRATVVLALHEGVADDRALLLLATELEAALAAGPDSALPPAPPFGFSHWLAWLADHAASPQVRAAAMACEAAEAEAPPDAFAASAPTLAAAQLLLDASTSRLLLEELPGRLGVSLEDALLVALGEALDGGPAVELVDRRRALPPGAPEAAGLVGNLDVLLPLQACASAAPLGARLRAAKTVRQRAEPLGLAFSAIRTAFHFAPPTLSVALLPAAAPDPAIRLHPRAPNVPDTVRAGLTVRVSGGRLALGWSEAAPVEMAEARLAAIGDSLRAIAGWAQGETAPLLTPGDFPLAGIDAATLDALAGACPDLEDIYPLSPMQEAMLLHSLSRQGSVVNFEQSCMRFTGALDSAALRKAWALVFERHAVLRSVFRWRGLERPLQLVRRNAPPPVELETWPGFSAERLEQRLAQDRAAGFDLEAGPLARLILIRVSAGEAYLIASFHHMLADGWCLAQLEREARAAYEALRRGMPPALPPPARFRDFIAWTATLEREGLRAAFIPLLAGAPAQPALHPAGNGAASYVTIRRPLPLEPSKALSDLSRRRGLTVAALAHLAWGLWTAARRGVADTVFCTTVSGRPPQVPGVEQMVGLFINNLPVRLRFSPSSPLLALAQEMQRQIAALQSQAQLSLREVAEAAGIADRASSLFDTLLVVENMPAGSDAWAGAGGLRVESVHNALKSAYSLTGVVVPGERIGLSLVLPDLDGTAAARGEGMMAEFAAVFAALPGLIDGTVAAVPLPAAAPLSPAEESPPIDDVPAPDAAPPAPPSDPIEATVLDVLAALLGPRLARSEDVLAAGLTSLGLATAAARLSERLARPVPVTALIEYRTAAALARALSGKEAGATAWDAVVPLTGGEGPPFICAHPIAGDVSAFLDLARAFPASIPFWALQAPGLEKGQEPPTSVAALAAANLDALARRGVAAPRFLGGYSFGGIVAYEMACQLHARGTPPERLIIIDTPAPLGSRSVLPEDPEQAQAQWLLRMAQVRARHHQAPLTLSLAELLAQTDDARFALAGARMRQAGLIAPEADAAWLRRAYRASRALYDAFLAYAPPENAPRDFKLGLVRAGHPAVDDLSEADRAVLATPDMGWSRLNDRVLGVHEVPGDHVSMLSGAAAVQTAGAIASFLDMSFPVRR